MTQVEKKKKNVKKVSKHKIIHKRVMKKGNRRYRNGKNKIKSRKKVVKKTIRKNVSKKKLLKTNVDDKDGKKKKMKISIRFKKPKTLKYARNPKCPRIVKSCHSKTLDKYGLIKYPLTSEKAMKKIEEINTLVFMCDKRANKKNIKKSVKSLFGIECDKINVLNTLNGDKKAYVRLSGEHDALEVANKIGIL
ncbi:60S ribosomal protein L23 [Plasmodium reichenowi]|uniref:60S ribosomal protein L23 n=1 Tax=Plasmodium reichenowi TaxID=5854 RepID=A0A2P9DLJ9_PLARE|nr:60S ribosomal protein L23 [Plasmodium reichenowi]